MQGRVRKRQSIVVEALGVIGRRSTDVVVVEDQVVAKALHFIRHQSGRRISVDCVAEEVAVSRRSLEKRYREALGRTILEEIQLARLERAKRLLKDTTYSVANVAEIAGFGSAGYFASFFHRRVGKTPRRYRIEVKTYSVANRAVNLAADECPRSSKRDLPA